MYLPFQHFSSPVAMKIPHLCNNDTSLSYLSPVHFCTVLTFCKGVFVDIRLHGNLFWSVVMESLIPRVNRGLECDFAKFRLLGYFGLQGLRSKAWRNLWWKNTKKFPFMPKNVRDEFSLLIKRSFKCAFETFPVRCPNAIFYFDDQLVNWTKMF